MKYRITGRLNTSDSTAVRGVINKYRVLSRESLHDDIDENGKPTFYFDVDTVLESKRNGIFNEIKPLIDEHGGEMSWHECSHDESNPRPCVIAEEYRK